ncbi:hypothetical protein [Bacillus sp. SH5-2]|nr:hypothetical protein [Bacillus sp. SH5-2]
MGEFTKDPGGHRMSDPGHEAGSGGGAGYADPGGGGWKTNSDPGGW